MSARPAFTISYLEMNADPKRPRHELNVLETSPIPPAFFRAMYSEVGRKWHWEDILALPEEEHLEYCNQPSKRFYTLIHKNAPAGFFVLHQIDETIDLSYFGLLEDVIGEGLGGKFLDYAVCAAWDTVGCKKMTVNTCTLDHPRALALYQSRGFEVTHTEDRPASL